MRCKVSLLTAVTINAFIVCSTGSFRLKHIRSVLQGLAWQSRISPLHERRE